MVARLEALLGLSPQQESVDPIENFPPAPEIVRVLNDSRIVSVELFDQDPPEGSLDKTPTKTLQIRVAVKTPRERTFGRKPASEFFEDHYATAATLHHAREWLIGYDNINPTETYFRLREREKVNSASTGIVLSSLEARLHSETPITAFDPRTT